MTQTLYPDRPPEVVSWPCPLPPLPPDRYWEQPPDPSELTGSPLHCLETSDRFDIYSYRVTRVVHATRTAFQHIVVADSVNYGRILILDGHIQSAEDDEDLYHEMLVQPAMLIHDAPRDVLIIGGGEGATLREVLAHRSVERATMVDIDREAVEVCRTHLPTWHRGAFDDPRARLHFDDGRSFVEHCEDRFDVAVIDVVDMLDNGPAQRLYTRQFHEALRARLRPGAVVTVQGMEFSHLDPHAHAALYRTLRGVYRHVASYTCTSPSFLSPWGFLIASDDVDVGALSAARIDRRIDERLGADWLAHLTGEFMTSCFCYDKEKRFLLSLPGPILEDGVDFVVPPEVGDTWPLAARLPARED